MIKPHNLDQKVLQMILKDSPSLLDIFPFLICSATSSNAYCSFYYLPIFSSIVIFQKLLSCTLSCAFLSVCSQNFLLHIFKNLQYILPISTESPIVFTQNFFTFQRESFFLISSRTMWSIRKLSWIS